jgi:hypothetical protein
MQQVLALDGEQFLEHHLARHAQRGQQQGDRQPGMYGSSGLCLLVFTPGHSGPNGLWFTALAWV